MNFQSDNFLQQEYENILPSYIINVITNLKQETLLMCYVCLENKPLQKRSNCTHSFCAECNTEWALRNPTCPMCRC